MRIEVPDGYFVPILKKTGPNMTNDMILSEGDFKGPQFEILKEGRHFRFPWYWGWDVPIKAEVIPKEHVGIVTRLYGKSLEIGQVIAKDGQKGILDDQKGILAEPLKPGRHYLNPWRYDVNIIKMVRIRPGHMGVVTLLVGDEPEDANVFVVKEGERGTQPMLLEPKLHENYSNPYLHMVTEIDVRSQKFEMAREFAITFPSKSGFDIRVEGTIEWAPDLKKLPELFVKYVDEDDLETSGGIDNIQRKIILPYARSFVRMIGGRYRAVDYITGDTRIKVQNDVERSLKKQCELEGIEIRSFVIRSTEPPEQIRSQYQRRELAQRQQDRFKKEIVTETGSVIMENGKPKLDSEGEAVRDGGRLAKILQERKKDRQERLGVVRVQIAQDIRQAEQYEKVEVTKARKELAVAIIRLEAAKDKAAAIVAQGEAAASVTVMKNKAEAEAVKAKISAFGQGEKYAEYQLIQKLSPGIHRILSNTDGLFAELFKRFTSIGDGASSGNRNN